MPPPRLIRLRRPPILHVEPGPFLPPLPSETTLDDVDHAWRGLCALNPRYHDGEMLTVLGVSRNGYGGVTINLAQISYRFHAVRHAGIPLGLQPLGVKAMVSSSDGDRFLMGQRSPSVSTYPGLWEFVPGGSVEPGMSIRDALHREWVEESGVAAESLRDLVPVAVLFDPDASTWEVVHRAELASECDLHTSWEHTSLRWLAVHEITSMRDSLSPACALMLELLPLPRVFD
ncbi:MAG: NUDIX domain-containing protein [Planctomycetota bacterium]|nr:NUDIX domain-containing protein [Planctomycetota bacterium]MDA1106118.1 NUDIX domain-containing protein [Planctomycetota bacterium]